MAPNTPALDPSAESAKGDTPGMGEERGNAVQPAAGRTLIMKGAPRVPQPHPGPNWVWLTCVLTATGAGLALLFFRQRTLKAAGHAAEKEELVMPKDMFFKEPTSVPHETKWTSQLTD